MILDNLSVRKRFQEIEIFHRPLLTPYSNMRILQESSAHSEDSEGLAKLAKPSEHFGCQPCSRSSDVRVYRSRPTTELLNDQQPDAATKRRAAAAFAIVTRHDSPRGEAAGDAGGGSTTRIAWRRADTQSTPTTGDVQYRCARSAVFSAIDQHVKRPYAETARFHVKLGRYLLVRRCETKRAWLQLSGQPVHAIQQHSVRSIWPVQSVRQVSGNR